MKHLLKKFGLYVIFFAALTILIFTNLLVYRQMQLLTAANSWVLHSHEVIENVNSALVNIINGEKLEQRYLISNDPTYLYLSQTAVQKSLNNIAFIKFLTRDNPEQQANTKNFENLIHAHVVLFKNILNIYNNSGQQAAIREIISEKYKSSTQEIQAAVDTINQKEYTLLQNRNNKSIYDTHLISMTVILAGSISVLFLLLSFFLLLFQQKKYTAEQQKINQKLEEKNKRIQLANRLKSEFLANMSHELRTPLNAIIGFSELMYREKIGKISLEQKEYLGDILTSSRHLLQLINDVLDLSKIESGKMEFHPELIDLRKLVSEIQDVLSSLIAKKSIHFETEIDPTLTNLILDPGKLKQVLYNYLSNAIKFTDEKGKISIRIYPEGETKFRLEVTDSGIGIREKDINKLFVEFQQIDEGQTKKYEGTGLGLALTRQIVTAQGGEIGVKSIPGHGSTFFAILPRITIANSTSNTKVTATSKPLIPASQLKVLVIESDIKDRTLILDTLTKAGFVVKTALNDVEGIEIVKKYHFDVITLALLPNKSGWNTLNQIRTHSLNKKVRIILVSVTAEKNSSVGFIVDDYLVKPISSRKLLSSIERVGIDIPGKKNNILIIDDDENTLRLAAQILKPIHCNLTCQTDALSALESLEVIKPDVIILDLLMPGINGFEFLNLLRSTQSGREIPVIIWTVKDLTDADRTRLLESAQAVIIKGNGSLTALLAELQYYIPISSDKLDKVDL